MDQDQFEQMKSKVNEAEVLVDKINALQEHKKRIEENKTVGISFLFDYDFFRNNPKSTGIEEASESFTQPLVVLAIHLLTIEINHLKKELDQL